MVGGKVFFRNFLVLHIRLIFDALIRFWETMLKPGGGRVPVNARSAFACLVSLGQFCLEDSGEKTFPYVTKNLTKTISWKKFVNKSKVLRSVFQKNSKLLFFFSFFFKYRSIRSFRHYRIRV